MVFFLLWPRVIITVDGKSSNISALPYNNVIMTPLPLGTGKYTTHGPHYATHGSNYLPTGPTDVKIWWKIMGH